MLKYIFRHPSNMSKDSREDYLINILRITEGNGVVKTTELANFMGVAPASVTEMLKILQKEGYVNYEKYKGFSLTDEGQTLARTVRRKHHIMERFLTDILDVDHQTAHDEAHAAEHTLSDETAEKICRIIGTKVDCDCSTCSNPCPDSGIDCNCVRITDAQQGADGSISHLSSEDPKTLKKLISMGFVPGRNVELVTKVSDKGARIIKIGETNIALDYDLASAIFIDIR